ncbi:MAG: PQQ-binding-like beta-propeller repeat protein [Candidatus Nanohaloarchaea archaeon]
MDAGWPTRGKNDRRNPVLDSGLPEEPEKQWSFRTNGEPDREPVEIITRGETVVSTFFNRDITAFSTETGEKLWERTGDGTMLAPSASGEELLVSSGSGLEILDIRTGKSLRVLELDQKLADFRAGASPAIVDQTAYINSGEGWVYALDMETGEGLWATQVAEETSGKTVAVNDSKVYTALSGSEGYELVALEAGTGELLWRQGLEEKLPLAPTVSPSGEIYITFRRAGRVTCISPEGEKRWSRSEPGLRESRLNATEDHAFAATNSKLVEMDPRTGETETLEKEGDWGHKPVIAGEKILLAGDRLTLYSTGDREKLWERELNSTTGPAIRDGEIYIGEMLEMGEYSIKKLG